MQRHSAGRKHRLVRGVVAAWMSALVAAGTGCLAGRWDYVLSVGLGELDLLAAAVPIEAAAEDPALDEGLRSRLRWVIAVRDFAHDEIGLNVGSSYQTFVNLNGQPLAWNLSASPKDAIEPYQWCLPVVGPIPYLGFFDFEQAVAERDRLVALGYDTFLYAVDAFSTLGLLPDPVTSAALDRDEATLADTVIHELLHNTIWSPGDTVYSESLAVFVGRTGALQFLERQYGPQAPQLRQAREMYEDQDRFNAFMEDLRDRLLTIYRSNRTREEKIADRTTVFEDARQRLIGELLPTLHHPQRYQAFTTVTLNNAYLLVNTRYYSRLELFGEVYDRVGGRWSDALGVFSRAAGSRNPFAYLTDFLAGTP